MTSFTQLPIEIKTMVFSYLDRPTNCHSSWDLTMASLVCREWRELAGHPDLWQEYRVTGGKRKLVGLLKSSRFLKVKYVELGTREKIDKTEVEEIFEALSKHTNTLEQVLVSDVRGELDIRGVKPEVLSRVVGRLDAFLVEAAIFSEEQLNVLFQHLSGPSSRLGRLSFPNCDLSSVPPDSLARAVSGLQSLIIPRATVTSEQVHKVFSHLDREEKPRCRKLDLKNVDLSLLEPSMLARVVSKMAVAELYDTRLSRHQLHCLVGAMAESHSLKELNIGGTYDTADPLLPHVYPDVLALGVARLEVAMLEGLNLTVEQIEEILEEAMEQTAKTEVLDLSYNHELSKANPDLLAQLQRSGKQVFANLSALPVEPTPGQQNPELPEPAEPNPALANPALANQALANPALPDPAALGLGQPAHAGA